MAKLEMIFIAKILLKTVLLLCSLFLKRAKLNNEKDLSAFNTIYGKKSKKSHFSPKLFDFINRFSA